MIMFMTVFFSIYGGMHLYAFLKVRRASILGTPASAALAAIMILMIFAPVLIRILERNGFELCAQGLALVGYTWMGALFLFVTVNFLFDAVRLFLSLAGPALRSDLAGHAIPARLSLIFSFSLTLAISAYGLFEGRAIRTETLTIKTRKIAKTIDRIRIAQISDIHLGLMVGEKRLGNILARVKDAEPDILVSTGDLVDGQMDNISGLIDLFRAISPKYGKFAVTGNHEFYAGLSRSVDFTEKAGFTYLRGQAVDVEGLLTIVGVDDDTGRRRGLVKNISEEDLLAGLPGEKFTLLLKHKPLVDKKALGLFDLQLSGHTHKGQIFPFSLITRLFFPFNSGFHDLGEESGLYVSRGSGTWGPPMRFLAPPEVTLIDLVPEKEGSQVVTP